MPKMRVVQVARKDGPFEMVERDLPQPGSGEVRVKVQACGVCHSDSIAVQGLLPTVPYPIVPGHEIAGMIDAVGSGVIGWSVGTRVGIGWFGGHCGRCEPCRRGFLIDCRNLRIPGITYDGGYADAMVAPADALARITEDVTTDLSRVPGMFVIARESAYTYQGKATDVRKIGEQLGVRYVLEGSVRRLDDGLRVNSQLVATGTGAHLWADRFDKKWGDLSAGQEEIVDRIGKTLNVALADLESARSKRERPTNPDAFDLILRARSLGLHPMGPEEHAERTKLYQQALQLDPKSILAMTGLAYELEYLQAYSGQGDPGRAART